MENGQIVELFSEYAEDADRQTRQKNHEARTFTAMDDKNIVELYFKRDENAIQQTQRKFGKRIVNISKNITGSESTAEEVENDTYLRAWENIPPTDPTAYLFAFLARIARNLSISVCRKRTTLKRGAVLVELSDEMAECLPSSCNIEQEAEAGMVLELINEFLFSKSEDKRNIFMRRYWYLDSVSEVAKRYGLTESSVKTTLFRLRAELREYLEERGVQV